MGTVTINANVYQIYDTQADAVIYFTASLSANAIAFIAATPTTQAQSLVMAANMLNRQPWQGTITDPVTPQPLAWPRIGLTDNYGAAVPSATIPQTVINGSFELAAALLVNPTLQDSASTSTNVKQVNANPVSVQFFSPVAGGRFPVVVMELLGFWLGSMTPSVGGSVAFGTGGPANDCEPHDAFAERFNVWKGI